MKTQSKILTWIGWVLTGLLSLLLTFSATMKFLKPPEVVEQVVNKFGYPVEVLLAIGIVEIACVILYLLPPTAILGAVLLTGYLGGATATHVRVQDDFIMPIIIGVVVWLGIYLRDPRLRALLPFRQSSSPSQVQ